MNPHPPPRPVWEKLATARRKVLAETPDQGAFPPFGFSGRIAARAMALRRNQNLSWWTRWTLRTALTASLAAGLLALLTPPDVAPLLIPPRLDVPSFTSL